MVEKLSVSERFIRLIRKLSWELFLCINGITDVEFYNMSESTHNILDRLRSTKVTPLSDYAHDTWSGWMRYLFDVSTNNADGTVTIPKASVVRWTMQMKTNYLDLPKQMQLSDIKEAHKILDIINE